MTPDSLPVKNIVIVGGGSAGWMTAIAFSGRFPDKHITVIDSTIIGPIGVGESVTGVVLAFVLDPLHGLTLGEFFRRCEPTFKLGIWYKNWHGPGTEYLSSIEAPAEYFQHRYPLHIEEFFAKAAADGRKLGDVLLYSQLMRAGKTDFYRNPDGSVSREMGGASCQFDAKAFAAWLAEVAAKRANVTHVDDIVEGYVQDAQSGRITAIRTRSGREVGGEFFIDCTGFHRLLLGKAYQPKWKSYADHIRVDSAIPMQTPYPEGKPIPNYTVSTAMPHGWQWQIPTQSRMGKGYIFSSRYVSDEQAVAEFRATGVDVGDSPTILRFSPGRFEQQWVGNVCAIGLSGVFSEPLEATTIHGQSVQIKLLTDLLLLHATQAAMPVLAATYNRLIAAAHDDYVDFINFHYHTGRADTAFWRDYQQPEAMTPLNRERLAIWQHTFPTREDFAPNLTQVALLTTNFTIWAPMLCAFGLLRSDAAQRVVNGSRYPAQLKTNLARYLNARNQILANGLTQAETIAYFRAQP